MESTLTKTNSPSMRWAWMTVLLLWPVALLNYMDRQMMASMKASVIGDIPMGLSTDWSLYLEQSSPIWRWLVGWFVPQGSNDAWGTMLGQFKWVYAFMSPIGGYVADRISRRFAICSSLFVWSAITLWTGTAESYSQLMWTRTLMGISEAIYIPAALALIADLHTRGTRSRAVSIHQTAIYCGIVLGGFGGYVADAPQLGWRFAFYAAGIVGMIYAFPLLFLLRDPDARPALKSSNGVGSSIAGTKWNLKNELLFNVNFILLVLCFTLPAFPAWVIRDWMPSILKEKFQIGQGIAGVSATLYYSLASLVAAFFAGWIADRWYRRHRMGRIFTSSIGLGLIVPALFGVGNASSLLMAIGFLILFGIGWGFFDCNNMPILSQIVRPELRATGYGIMNFVSMTSGGFADKIFGVVKDKEVPLNYTFGFFSLIALVSVGLMLCIRPRADLVDGEVEA